MTYAETPSTYDGFRVAVNWGGNTRHVVKDHDDNTVYGGTWDYHLAACGSGPPIYDPRDSRVPSSLSARDIETAKWCKRCAKKFDIALPDNVGALLPEPGEIRQLMRDTKRLLEDLAADDAVPQTYRDRARELRNR